jgi:hypothetical protein
MKLVDGGEINGYCFASFDHMRKVTEERKSAMAPLMTKFPNLQLAGTITPWMDPTKRKGWVSQYCPAWVSGPGFAPLLQYLSSSYRYVWIYAATDSDYDPYNPAGAAPMNQVLREAVRPAHKWVGEHEERGFGQPLFH